MALVWCGLFQPWLEVQTKMEGYSVAAVRCDAFACADYMRLLELWGICLR